MFSFKKKKEVINLPELSNFNERTYPKKLKKIVAQLETCKSEDLNYIAECILQKMGYTVQNIDGYKDGGIDVYAFSNNKKAIAVQCKAWNPQKTTERISKPLVAAFKGIFPDKGFPNGIFITTHFFTDQALEIAGENLLLVDRKKLIELLAHFYPEMISELFYYKTLTELEECKSCKNGKKLKLYNKKKRNYYYICETCGEYSSFNYSS